AGNPASAVAGQVGVGDVGERLRRPRPGISCERDHELARAVRAREREVDRARRGAVVTPGNAARSLQLLHTGPVREAWRYLYRGLQLLLLRRTQQATAEERAVEPGDIVNRSHDPSRGPCRG